MAQSFIAVATVSATLGSSFVPFSMVAFSDLKTAFGSRSCITRVLKTLAPKISLAGVALKFSAFVFGS